ncbi:MAG: hypothetical protein HGA71_20825 [Azonexaceae bacterium]|nr:hypothetical protein [Azonexaceae bacterium]
MPNSSWKIKILVNNWVGEGPCIAEHGLSMAQCEYWCDTLDRWAEDLVDPASGGS